MFEPYDAVRLSGGGRGLIKQHIYCGLSLHIHLDPTADATLLSVRT